MADAHQLMDDLEELKNLEKIAKRPRVLSLISSEIRNLETKIQKASAPVTDSEANAKSQATDALTALKYVPLDKFSWDQDNVKIKIYVFLEGVQEEKLETVFKPTSVDIKFHDVQGRNYRCAITKLNKKIFPEKCKVLVRPSKVVITLFKASEGNWLDLHYKEDKLKPSMDSEKDPMAGIMDLMKNMYEEGDDEMKKTIAKAWSDARSEKTANPLQRFGS